MKNHNPCVTEHIFIFLSWDRLGTKYISVFSFCLQEHPVLFRSLLMALNKYILGPERTGCPVSNLLSRCLFKASQQVQSSDGAHPRLEPVTISDLWMISDQHCVQGRDLQPWPHTGSTWGVSLISWGWATLRQIASASLSGNPASVIVESCSSANSRLSKVLRTTLVLPQLHFLFYYLFSCATCLHQKAEQGRERKMSREHLRVNFVLGERLWGLEFLLHYVYAAFMLSQAQRR